MNLQQIKENLNSPDYQNRLNAIKDLYSYDAELAVPLIKSKMLDQQFLVRSFVAMGLGKKQTAESFAALLQMVKFDSDPNVRAEASNSLSLFGKVASSHLVQIFAQDEHWLVRRSILAALVELDCAEDLYEVCLCGVKGEDITVKETSLQVFGLLAQTNLQEPALSQILSFINDPSVRIRIIIAKTLAEFDSPLAKEALLKLKSDQDPQVVNAVLESLV